MADDPIPTTRDRSGTYDAIATAKPGEPLFPIQGGDPHGPATVEFWADLERSAARAEANAERAALRFRKAGDAEAIAWAMRAYQKGEAEAAAVRQGYADNAPDDLDDEDQRLRRARISAAERLSNMVGEGSDIADTLEAIGYREPAVAAIREAVAQLQVAALTIEPRRGRERS